LVEEALEGWRVRVWRLEPALRARRAAEWWREEAVVVLMVLVVELSRRGGGFEEVMEVVRGLKLGFEVDGGLGSELDQKFDSAPSETDCL
jgi:hypothetical protein